MRDRRGSTQCQPELRGQVELRASTWSPRKRDQRPRRSVTLCINDLNDVNPVFSSGVTASVNENVATTTVVYDANCDRRRRQLRRHHLHARRRRCRPAEHRRFDRRGSPYRQPELRGEAELLVQRDRHPGSTATTQSVTLGINDLNDVNPGVQLGVHGKRQRERGDEHRCLRRQCDRRRHQLRRHHLHARRRRCRTAEHRAATGEVRLNASPNFEAKASYSFNVIATQGATATTQSVTLGINDLNDVNPVFSSGSTANVNENVATTPSSTTPMRPTPTPASAPSPTR